MHGSLLEADVLKKDRNSIELKGLLWSVLVAGEQSELPALTRLPISKVIFTSSVGCIMYDRVNQLKTGRGSAREGCPLRADSHIISDPTASK